MVSIFLHIIFMCLFYYTHNTFLGQIPRSEMTESQDMKNLENFIYADMLLSRKSV